MKNKPLFLNDKWYVSKGKNYFPARSFQTKEECRKECEIEDMKDAFNRYEKARMKLEDKYPELNLDDYLC